MNIIDLMKSNQQNIYNLEENQIKYSLIFGQNKLIENKSGIK